MPIDFSYKFYRDSGEAMQAMYQAIFGAQKSIFWEIYIFIDDAVGSRFVDLLCAKAIAGLDVKIVFDAMGSAALSKNSINRLQESGVDIQWYNKLYPEWHLGKWFNRIWFRNHRKVLLIDEEIAFLGGVNIELQHKDWDDLFIRLTGKVIRPLLRGFAKIYIRSGGEKKNVLHLLHPRLTAEFEKWKEHFDFIIHSPFSREHLKLRRMINRTLMLSKESFSLLTPYYAPDFKFIRLIYAAKKRGVKVNIFLPERPDYRILAWIARAYFRITQAAGAKIYLLKKMNHGKAFGSDSNKGFVGSANLTPRSFDSNEEVGLYFDEPAMVDDLNKYFASLEKEGVLVEDVYFKKPGWWLRFNEWLGKVFGKYI